MDDCIFCKIVRGDIPSNKVYEDDDYIAFMDIFPRAKGHTLLAPKEHFRWVYDVPDFGGYFERAKKVALAIQKTVGANFVGFVTVGEEVPHAHIHILPQVGEETLGITFTPVINLSKEEIAKLAQDIHNNVG